MAWVITISIVVFLLLICWSIAKVDGFSDFLILAILFGGVISIIFAIVSITLDVRKYKANVSESIGCKRLIVQSEKQFEVWRKEKHGGTYSKLRYSIAKNEFNISAIEFVPGDIIPTKKEDNAIVVEVIKTSNDIAETVEYSVNNQSRSCL